MENNTVKIKATPEMVILFSNECLSDIDGYNLLFEIAFGRVFHNPYVPYVTKHAKELIKNAYFNTVKKGGDISQELTVQEASYLIYKDIASAVRIFAQMPYVNDRRTDIRQTVLAFGLLTPKELEVVLETIYGKLGTDQANEINAIRNKLKELE